MEIDNRLAEWRAARQIAAAELARRVGVSRQTIYAIEAGTYVPNTLVALRLARELSVKVEELFGLGDGTRAEGEVVGATPLGVGVGTAVRLAQVGAALVAAEAEAGLTFLGEADGVVVGARGRQVRVRVVNEERDWDQRVVVAGCDPALGLLAETAGRLAGVDVVTVAAPSRLALEWLKAGLVHMAGMHLEDRRTGEYNRPQVRQFMRGEEAMLYTFARWEEGLVVAAKNPLQLGGVEELWDRGLRMVNRERGSGSRALVDGLLQKAGKKAEEVRGYAEVRKGHLAVAREVAEGRADGCVATMSAARVFGLGFVPLREERFDLVVRRADLGLAGVRAVLDTLQRAAFRQKLEAIAGYDVRETGREVG